MFTYLSHYNPKFCKSSAKAKFQRDYSKIRENLSVWVSHLWSKLGFSEANLMSVPLNQVQLFSIYVAVCICMTDLFFWVCTVVFWNNSSCEHQHFCFSTTGFTGCRWISVSSSNTQTQTCLHSSKGSKEPTWHDIPQGVCIQTHTHSRALCRLILWLYKHTKKDHVWNKY